MMLMLMTTMRTVKYILRLMKTGPLIGYAKLIYWIWSNDLNCTVQKCAIK